MADGRPDDAGRQGDRPAGDMAGGEPDDAPSGLPEEAPEGDPLGVPEARPEGEGDRERGPDAMPGVPHEGEPPSAG
jgi:hypothetical protein